MLDGMHFFKILDCISVVLCAFVMVAELVVNHLIGIHNTLTVKCVSTICFLTIYRSGERNSCAKIRKELATETYLMRGFELLTTHSELCMCSGSMNAGSEQH